MRREKGYMQMRLLSQPEEYLIRLQVPPGDGYRFAQECGHKVTELTPSLVPMEVKEEYAEELMDCP